ncbi:MAG: hypothetical protein RL550_1390 [Actinomycetota bacterium]|jgi:hypothetical protein
MGSWIGREFDLNLRGTPPLWIETSTILTLTATRRWHVRRDFAEDR